MTAREAYSLYVERAAEAANEADGPALGGHTAQAGEKGPDARRRPKVAREAYSLYVERAVEGANEADGPLSSL
jgi:hypothetical protein